MHPRRDADLCTSSQLPSSHPASEPASQSASQPNHPVRLDTLLLYCTLSELMFSPLHLLHRTSTLWRCSGRPESIGKRTYGGVASRRTRVCEHRRARIQVHINACSASQQPTRKRGCAYIRHRRIMHRKSHVCAGAAESETTRAGGKNGRENPSGIRIPIAERGSKSPFFHSCDHAFPSAYHTIFSPCLSHDRLVHPATVTLGTRLRSRL